MKKPDASTPRILIADDQADVREALRLMFKGEGYQTDVASSPARVLEAIKAEDFALVLMDLNYARTTSGVEGLDLLMRLQAFDGTLPVVVMTAWGSVDLAVEAMRRGARDFIKNRGTMRCWRRAHQIELSQALRRAGAWKRKSIAPRPGFPKLIAESAPCSPFCK